MENTKLLQNSTDRPAWVSDSERGMFHGYKHRHRRPRIGADCIQRNYYGHTMGFSTRAHAAELLEK